MFMGDAEVNVFLDVKDHVPYFPPFKYSMEVLVEILIMWCVNAVVFYAVVSKQPVLISLPH